ncbi:MAG: preprotein translocase subunit SecE [Saprospiraceae bacterium]
MNSLVLYIRESYDELANKVTWPSWSSLQSTTIVVLVATVIITLIIFLMDLASKNLMELIYTGGTGI